MVKFENNSLRRLGIMGGMFNPVHNGHLRVAVECKDAFSFDEIRMIPCAEPPHRENPKVNAQLRLEILRLALENVDYMKADGRELERQGLSYTIDTLRSLKSEFPDDALFLIMGSDAFQNLNAWHEWREILTLSNIVIAHRPDNENNLNSEVGQLLKSHFTDDKEYFLGSDAGKIFSLDVKQLEISSSQIRALLGVGRSAKFLVPEVVLSFIEKNRLYK